MVDPQTKPTVAHHQYSDNLVAAKVMANYNSPRKRRSHQVDEIDEMKRKFALSTDKEYWQTTGMPVVNQTKRPDGSFAYYFVKFLKYTKC
jgi:hypothetical protein